MFSSDTDAKFSPATDSAPEPERLAIQWGSGGESRMTQDDRESVSKSFIDAQDFRVFPMHGGFGTLSLDRDGHTVWLYVGGAAYIAGEIVPERKLRPVASAGTNVDISGLAPDLRRAVMALLKSK